MDIIFIKCNCAMIIWKNEWNYKEKKKNKSIFLG